MAEFEEAGKELADNGHVLSQEEQVDLHIGTTIEEDGEISSSVNVRKVFCACVVALYCRSLFARSPP